jgi:hypothetical protein
MTAEQQGHTPGPWRTQGWVPTWAYIPIKDASHNLVCSMYPNSTLGYDRDAVAANARLIAASPDLLAALKTLLDEAENFSVSGVYFTEKCMNHKGPALAHDAIAKAEGRSS